MFKLLGVKRRIVLFASCLVGLVIVIALTLSVKTNSQQLKVLNQKAKSDLLKQIESSPEQPLKVVGNNDCPFRIVQATVKQISGSDFTKLTGQTTDLGIVSSVPEINLTNTSDKTIKQFVIVVRNPATKSTRVVVQSRISIAPGDSYTFKREHFVKMEKVTVADKAGARQEWVLPKMDSEKYWLLFADNSDMYATVGKVVFEDESSWMIKEGGDVK